MSNRVGPRHLVVAGFLFLLPTMILVLAQGNSGYDAERGVTRFSVSYTHLTLPTTDRV